MRDGFVKAAVSSPELRVADCRFNREQLAAAAGRMAKEGVKLLVFPEYSLTGYTCNDLFLQDTLLDGALQGLRIWIWYPSSVCRICTGGGFIMWRRLSAGERSAALCQRAMYRIMENFMRRGSSHHGTGRPVRCAFPGGRKPCWGTGFYSRPGTCQNLHLASRSVRISGHRSRPPAGLPWRELLLS